MAGRKMGEDSAHCSWGLGGLACRRDAERSAANVEGKPVNGRSTLHSSAFASVAGKGGGVAATAQAVQPLLMKFVA
ncbi:hypothetical protein RAN3_1632 [plant metagenome]|uniref:Uncharacterized protein n=1 Tax=plant metagenome TaxID=1297885 RepID=A0A484V5P6_9ZZZZ